jgi:DNA recombination protein RmuC
MLAVFAVSALLAGLLLGFLLRGATARTERNEFERRVSELSAALNSAGTALTKSQEESAARAGFESLAHERERTIELLKTEKASLSTGLQAKSDAESQAQARIRELETELRKERESLDEKVKLLEDAKQALANQFQALAADILEQKSKTFSEGSQKELNTLLEPLKAQIGDFRKKVEEAQSDSKTGVTELKTLIGTLGNLNQALTEEAHNLATALRRDTKAQGNWGETILRNILDKSGLQEGLHYSFQQSFTEVDSESAPVQRRQTDVVVKLPGGRHLVVDSKVSLNAYNDSVNAENETARAEALKRHLVSVRNHFNELAGRNYHALEGVQSPDFAVMFVPIEPAFLLALQNDDGLWHDAYAKGVLLAGPTTVLFVIRIVEDLWRQEKQAQSVDKVMKRGAELYDKFVGFVHNLGQVGDALMTARRAYDEASRQLSTGSGNLVRQVELLRELGVAPKTKKQIPARLLEASKSEDGAGEEAGLALAAESAEEGEDR